MLFPRQSGLEARSEWIKPDFLPGSREAHLPGSGARPAVPPGRPPPSLSFHGDAGTEAFEYLVPDSLHGLQILDLLELPVLLAVLDNPFRDFFPHLG